MSSDLQHIPGPTRRVRVLDVVALNEDLLDDGLLCGHVGTVVEDLGGGVYEVEFSDDQGRCYALAAVPATSLMALHHRPVQTI